MLKKRRIYQSSSAPESGSSTSGGSGSLECGNSASSTPAILLSDSTSLVSDSV